MELRRLTGEVVSRMTGRAVVMAEYSSAYVDEIYARYPDLPRPVLVVDEYARHHGLHDIAGVPVEVTGYERLGELPDNAVIIIATGYYQEAYEKILEYLRPIPTEGIIYYYANRNTEYYEAYLEQYADTPLQDMIIFRSGPAADSYVRGMDFADNARALFEYMLSVGLNRKYTLIWLVKYPAQFRAVEEKYGNIRFLSWDAAVSESEKERDDYYRALCLARFIFFTDAYGFCRYARADQVRVQLWHGCGFKTRVNFARCEKRYEYNIVVSPLYAGIHQRIYGLRPDQTLVTGYPKEDWLFHPIGDWRERLGIPDAARYIFWLPTFRTPLGQLSSLTEQAPAGETGLPLLQSADDLERLDGMLRSCNAILIVKLHPFQNRAEIHIGEMKNILLLDNDQLTDADVQINQLLGHAAALISDYSSAAVDYLLLNRPVAFTLDDAEEYGSSRGFVFSPLADWLPGERLYTVEEFLWFMREVLAGDDPDRERREKLTEKFHSFRDDQSSRRVLEALEIL